MIRDNLLEQGCLVNTLCNVGEHLSGSHVAELGEGDGGGGVVQVRLVLIVAGPLIKVILDGFIVGPAYLLTRIFY